MKMPFSTEDFLQVFENYNHGVFPVQILIYILGLIAIYFAFKPSRESRFVINSVLSFLWLWMGIVYHIVYFSKINKAAYIFGLMFIIQSVIFMMRGIITDRLLYDANKSGRGLVGGLLVTYALVFYPTLGLLIGHIYPAAPTFGAPCPTTIFTFGILLMADKKVSFDVLIIPLLWVIIGSSAMINFGMMEDLGLAVSGVIAVIFILRKNRGYSRRMTMHGLGHS